MTSAPIRSLYETRFDWGFAAITAAALLVGIVVSAFRVDSAVRVVVAAVVAGGWVAAVQLVPPATRRVSWAGELLAVCGSAAALVAIGLTGGGDSPYLLLSLMPTLLAASVLGLRVGLEVAALSTLGLVLVAAARSETLLSGALLVAGGLNLVVAVGFSQAYRAIQSASQASADARRATAAAEAEAARIQSAHDLLLELTLVADAAELSPVRAGQATIDNLAELTTFDSCLVALSGDDGPVVVARRGDELHQHHRTTWPLMVSDREVGFVALSRGEDFDDAERAMIALSLRPLALAFSNMTMLQDLARRAVIEERVRLARALHDEIGPSLASVGLGLDVALMRFDPPAELAVHLEALRTAIGGLIEEIRTTVTDLRHEGRSSLVQRVRTVAAEANGGGPRVIVELDERRPPRPSIATDLMALVTEALRNAIRHSGASQVNVEGFVDHDSGRVVVRDDGTGFDPASVQGRHFGLVGMAERADKAGLSLEVDSNPGGGTTVSVDWGTR